MIYHSAFYLQLISDYGIDSNVRTMLDSFDFYILVLINGDGYEYSHTTVSVTLFYFLDYLINIFMTYTVEL